MTTCTKRNAISISLSADEAYAVQSCTQCRLQFNTAGSTATGSGNDARTPRVLHCGHTLCTACIAARIRQESARKWRVACPVDGEQTPVPKGDASKLGPNYALVAELARLVAAGPLPFRVHIKNLAGDSWPLVVTADTTIGDLKRCIHEARAECAVHLQRLLIQGADAAGAFTVLQDDAATLGALGIGGECVVSLVMRDGFRGVEHVRAFGAAGNDDAQFNLPWDVCASAHGELFVTDFRNHRVQVLRASDGVHMRTIHSWSNGTDRFWGPSNVCLSRDGILLFVSELNHCVQVFRAADGSHVRTIGARGNGVDQLLFPRGICVSPDNERLYVVDCDNCRVQVYRAVNGAHLHAIDASLHMQAPTSICVSADDQFIFVSDRRGAIQVFRTANGAHVRSVGGDLVRRTFGVQLSTDDSLLFVADDVDHCVRVLDANSGACVLTINSQTVGTGTDVTAHADRLSRPRGINWTRTTTGDEQLFVTDASTSRIHCFSALIF